MVPTVVVSTFALVLLGGAAAGHSTATNFIVPDITSCRAFVYFGAAAGAGQWI